MKVVIIMGSASDQEWSERIKVELKKWDIEVVEHVSSAHKVPEKTFALIQKYNQEEQIIFVAIAGRSNALSGVISANAIHPVIACPPLKDKNDYLINIHSTLQMPSDTPALTVLDPQNVAGACARIFGLVNEDIRQQIIISIQNIKNKFE